MSTEPAAYGATPDRDPTKGGRGHQSRRHMRPGGSHNAALPGNMSRVRDPCI